MEKTIEQELKELGFEMKDREDDILFDDTESRKNHWIEYFTYDKEYNVFDFNMHENVSPKEIEILYRFCKERKLI